MKLSQLSLADYNQLDSIPVINQDLSASGFTPVANTYYKHTGTTTASYTNGVIYYYNSTSYVALDGSVPGLATVAKTGSYNDLIDKPNIVQTTGNSTSDVMSQKAVTDELNTKVNSADLAQVATSGSYNDLSNKPTNYVTTDTDGQEIRSKKKFLTDQFIIANGIDIGASAPAPEYNQYRLIDFLDKNEKRIGIVGASIDTNKCYGAYLQAGNVTSMGVLSTPDGFGYSYGPIPPNKDNTNKLATTGWVLGNTSFIPFYSDSLSTGTYRSTNLPTGCSLVYIEDRQKGLSGYLYKNSGAMEFHELYFVTNFYTTLTDAKTNLTIYKLKINGTQVEKTYKNLFISSSGKVEVGEEYVENGTFYYKVLK